LMAPRMTMAAKARVVVLQPSNRMPDCRRRKPWHAALRVRQLKEQSTPAVPCSGLEDDVP
jgi:hypothetical protein